MINIEDEHRRWIIFGVHSKNIRTHVIRPLIISTFNIEYLYSVEGCKRIHDDMCKKFNDDLCG